mmetsp:Transcript_72700/g.116014  ORF Transcript_72700/g.116014 Transcript_72700/m.116014 type:complete len:121 (+) Transcript_72700:86-448(+)|eukprot:CAMPEP_0197056440 /NCGR_PEP_ID=MMETSP1384-20130603/84617_1 /TAXON_ID=29189 /ORGANISM="Ammonia sp." /LENGTH=120 /DNA_ID=CAMNT_0042490433 /DNA_START=81 /DNA_END=443 /DNA_ORIENTATION=+
MTHSFCFSIPYGIIVSIGGLIGFIKKGSTMSLIMGLLFGGISAALGYSAYQKYFTNSSDKNEILAGLIVSAILSIVMCFRWNKSGKFMPAGLVGVLSVIMSLFFVYRLVNPTLPRKLNRN